MLYVKLDCIFNREWIIQAPPKNIFLLLSCIRMLMRDCSYQKHFYQLGGLKSLSDVSNSTVGLLYCSLPLKAIPLIKPDFRW